MAEAEPPRPRRMGRRAVLRAAVALPALAGCAGLGSSVRIAVPWSGWELGRFRDVLDMFTTRTGLGTEVVALGDDIGAVLGARASGAPDVVLLPRPGLIHEHETQLKDVDFAWQQPAQFSDQWRRLVHTGGRLLGVPFKAAHKSVLWYRINMLKRAPTTWPEWLDACQQLIDDGRTPLALGAADGWPLSDLFENILLAQGQDVYLQAKSKSGWQGPVRPALEMLGALLSKDGVLAGGKDRALITQFEDSVLQVFKHGEAAMVVAPDFAYPVIERYARLDGNVGLTQFPGLGSTVMAGGDIAVLPKPGSDGGRELIKWLATEVPAERWASRGGFLAAHQDVPNGSYPDPRLAKLASELHGGFEFDLSDELGAAGDVLLRALQDFLDTVGDGRGDRIESAAQIVMDQVAKAVSQP